MGFTGKSKRHDYTESFNRKLIPLTPEEIHTLRTKGFELDLIFPVSCNKLNQPTAAGGIILTNEARGYYQQMEMHLYAAWQHPPLEGRLRVDIWLHEPNRIRRDVNNYTKTLMDGLQRGKVFLDDAQIDETHIYRGDLVEGGRCRVVIREIAPADTVRKSLREVNEGAKKLAAHKEHAKLVMKAEDTPAPRMRRLTRFRPDPDNNNIG